MEREAKFRKDLSMPGMVAEMRRCFERVRCFEQRIEDGVSSRGVSLSDCLMSGLAIFALKYPSLLRFDRDARGLGEPSAREGNLRSLFGIGRAPSDSRMRERLDVLDPEDLRRPFKRLFALAQRGGVLREYEWLGGRHVLSVDGTEHCFRWSNGAPLNDANADLEVNFLEYWERRPKGKDRHFSWVTE